MATNKFLKRLSERHVLISDGATGTYLQNNGLEAGGCPELMNDTHPDVIRGMARAYFSAGSDMVETNSFGGSRYMLSKYHVGDRVEELNRLGAEHARSAAGEHGLVLGSIGPTGELLEPSGTATEEEGQGKNGSPDDVFWYRSLGPSGFHYRRLEQHD